MAPTELGNHLKKLRLRSKLSVRGAAKAAHVSPTYLWQIEKGDRKPSATILQKLARIYQVKAAELYQAAGYLEAPDPEFGDLDRLDSAFNLVRTDPEYQFGTYLQGTALTSEVKRYIVELYEKATGRKLL